MSSVLSTCPSGAKLNINGPVLFSSGTSGKSTIMAGSVYWYGTSPSKSQFYESPTVPYYPPFTQLNSPYVDTLQNLPAPNINTLPSNPAPVAGIYQPGVYTSMLGNASLAPGVYYFTGASAGVDLMARDSLSGNGVMLYFTNSASIAFAANSTIALSPATSGSYTGVTIWQDKSDTVAASVSGNANTSGLTGVVYLPGTILELNGTGTFYATNLVTQNIKCSGGGNGSIDLGYTYVPKTLPTLSFKKTPPASATVGSTARVLATSTNTKGSAIVYTIDGTSTATCTVSANVVTFSSPGKCIVDVNQRGTAVTVGGTTTYYYAAYEIQSPTNVSAG